MNPKKTPAELIDVIANLVRELRQAGCPPVDLPRLRARYAGAYNAMKAQLAEIERAKKDLDELQPSRELHELAGRTLN